MVPAVELMMPGKRQLHITQDTKNERLRVANGSRQLALATTSDRAVEVMRRNEERLG